VCAEVSSAHLLPWDRGEGEPRGASAAHLGQVLGQQIQILILFDIFLVKLKKKFDSSGSEMCIYLWTEGVLVNSQGDFRYMIIWASLFCRCGMCFPMPKLLASSAVLLHRPQQLGFLLNQLNGHGEHGTQHQKLMTVLLSASS